MPLLQLDGRELDVSLRSAEGPPRTKSPRGVQQSADVSPRTRKAALQTFVDELRLYVTDAGTMTEASSAGCKASFEREMARLEMRCKALSTAAIDALASKVA